MSIEWYYARGDKQFGPIDDTELRRLAEIGQLSQTDLVWKDGMVNWLPAARIKGLIQVSDDATSKPGFSSAIPPSIVQSSSTGQKPPNVAPLNAIEAPPKAAQQFGVPMEIAGQKISMKLIAIVGKWVCVAFACLSILSSMNAEFAPAGAQAAAIACFFGICARLFQAEQHNS